MNNPRIFSGRFPMTRLRRMRQFPWLRKLVSETKLSVDDLIWPLFIHEHEGSEPIASMPGVERLGIDGVVRAVGEARALGIPAVALFPVVDVSKKNEEADESFHENNLICRATRAIRKEHGDSPSKCCASRYVSKQEGTPAVSRDLSHSSFSLLLHYIFSHSHPPFLSYYLCSSEPLATCHL